MGKKTPFNPVPPLPCAFFQLPDWQAQVNASPPHALVFSRLHCPFLENKVLSRFDAERIDHDDAFFIDEFEVLIRFRDRLRLANHGE